MSLRASVTTELVLDDVRLPASTRCCPRSTGLRGPLSCLNEARFGIVFGRDGRRARLLEAALEYSKTRVQFGKPIGAFQLTQEKLAEMAVEVNQGALLALHLGRLKDAGTLRPEHVSLRQARQRQRGAGGRAARRARSSAPTGSRSSTRSSGT